MTNNSSNQLLLARVFNGPFMQKDSIVLVYPSTMACPDDGHLIRARAIF